MSKTKKMELTNLEILNIVAWYKDFKASKKNEELPLRVQYDLERNIAKMIEPAQSFETFRNDRIKDIQNEFITDEKSYIAKEIQRDENGNPVIGEDGKAIEEEIRKVKDEYFADYQDKIIKMNAELEKIAVEKEEISVKTFDLDEMIDKLENTSLKLDDLNMLAFMDNEGE